MLFDRALPHSPDNPFRRLSPPLYFLLSSCYAWPFSWRKLALTVCRVQQDPQANYRLQQEIDEIKTADGFTPFVGHPLYRKTVTFEDVIHHLSIVAKSPILCSVLSYFTRAERLAEDEEYRIQKEKIIRKELQAALHEDRPQCLNWASLTVPHVPLYTDGGYYTFQTMKMWRAGVVRLKQIFEEQQHIFIPHYNRKKNIGWLSQDFYYNLPNGSFYVPKGDYNKTQRDLMVLYHEEGLQIPGPMEMRFAWKYNDLKGRCYYATGGDSLWRGLFIKQIIKDLLNLLPSTHTYTRYDPNRVTYTPLADGECVITYDFSSFTTSLAELKYFLTYLARQLSGITFRYLDLHQGILEVDLGTYINEYNTSINMNAEFDYSRLDVVENLIILHQCRSGMLGAQGNIGLSTLAHGLAMSGINDDPSTSCVVGDDALFRQWAFAIALCISRAQLLAPIESSKFHVWDNPTYYDEDSVLSAQANGWQFLKRPLMINESGKVKTGLLIAYPNIADALLPPDNFHTTNSSPNRFVQFTKCAKQWGAYLNRLYLSKYEPDSDEISSLIAPMVSVYEAFGVPLVGAFVGSTLELGGREYIFPVTIPPVDISCFYEHWIDSHARFFHGTTMKIPVAVDFSIPSPECLGVGHKWICTLHRIQRVCEDLGYLRSEIIHRTIILNEETSSDLKQVLYGRTRMVHEVECIKMVPQWYNDIIADEGPI